MRLPSRLGSAGESQDFLPADVAISDRQACCGCAIDVYQCIGVTRSFKWRPPTPFNLEISVRHQPLLLAIVAVVNLAVGGLLVWEHARDVFAVGLGACFSVFGAALLCVAWTALTRTRSQAGSTSTQ